MSLIQCVSFNCSVKATTGITYDNELNKSNSNKSNHSDIAITRQEHTKKTQCGEEENTNTRGGDNAPVNLKMRILLPRQAGKVTQGSKSNPTEKVAKSYEIGSCSCGLKYLINYSQAFIQRLATVTKSAKNAAKQ